MDRIFYNLLLTTMDLFNQHILSYQRVVFDYHYTIIIKIYMFLELLIVKIHHYTSNSLNLSIIDNWVLFLSIH